MQFTGSVMNHNHNGEYQSGGNWYRLPNGFTIQWGENKINKRSNLRVNFPRRFNQTLQVIANYGAGISGNCYQIAVTDFNSESFNMYCSENEYQPNARWIALGWS